MGNTRKNILKKLQISSILTKEFREYLKDVRRAERDFQGATLQFGIIGVSGTGKSSLINALAGKAIAEVGVKETTGVSGKIAAYEFDGIILIDLPGVGTANWKTGSYFKNLMKYSPLGGGYQLRVKDFDCFIIVLANRILEEDLKLYHLIVNRLKKKCFLVRSKFDIDADNNYRTSRKSENVTYQEIIQDVWKSFPKEEKARVFIISTAEPARGDFDALETAISDSLPDVKGEKFIAYVAAHSKNFLKKKRKVAEKHALRLAVISAANAINPVPGLDLALDIGILIKLSFDLREIYGLTEEKVQFEAGHNGRSEDWTSAFRRRVAKTCAVYLTKEGIAAFLKEMGPRLEGRLSKSLQKKHLLSWIPFVGPAIAAISSFKLTSVFALELIDKFEAQAFELSSMSP
jgi:GTP-binding protein EngB required for normal cell division